MKPARCRRDGAARSSRGRLVVLALLCCLPLLYAACGTPVGVVRVSPDVAHRELTTDVLTTGELSIATKHVLQERGLARLFETEPEAALARLHAVVIFAGRWREGDLRAGRAVLLPSSRSWRA